MKSFIFLFSMMILFTSCEKVIELDLENTEPTLVIEGNITNQPGPYYVKLTKTLPFDQSSIYPGVENAQVIISDNMGISDTLKYTENGIYATSKLEGVAGRTYTLVVQSEGKTYKAKSTMPQYVPFEAIRFNKFTFAGEDQNVVIPIYKDPTSLGNNYNFVLTVNDTLDNTYLVWNDNTNNGVENQRPLRSNNGNLQSGDQVKIEMQCLDLSVYQYYFTLSQIASGGPGGGTTPSNPPNNISGGALGLFSAHTTQTRQIVIP
jgi:hypothetical protein